MKKRRKEGGMKNKKAGFLQIITEVKMEMGTSRIQGIVWDLDTRF